MHIAGSRKLDDVVDKGKVFIKDDSRCVPAPSIFPLLVPLLCISASVVSTDLSVILLFE